MSFAALTMTAQTQNEQWFEQANAAYNAGNYDSAMMLYEQILATDVESVPLYYNMGNAYYKMREYPMAIYYYEKALKLDPSNDDVRTFIGNGSMNLIRRAVAANFIPVASTRDMEKVAETLARENYSEEKIKEGIVVFIVLALSVLFAAQLKQAASKQDQAIVMSPTVTVKSSPNEASIDLFVLHEGTKVTLLDEADGWNKIKIANGSVGWLQADFMRRF